MARGEKILTHDWPVWAGLALYTVLRLALLPANPVEAQGFSHDSAYITIVADNLRVGRGYVNDAHWLVFLHPQELPVPYHNANPLYPTLVAGVSWLSGQSTAWAGFAIAAISSSLLLAALYVLANAWVAGASQRAALAAAGTFFPVVFDDSLKLTPDALCTALTAWCAVCLVCGRGLGSLILCGILFGLAWLTRSSVLLMAPAACVYLCMRDSVRAAIPRGVVVLTVAILVALPWLLHTAAVWGSPLRSDAGFYLLQDYHARNLPGSVEEFWHSTDVPAGLFDVIGAEPMEFGSFYLQGLPIFFRNLLGSLAASRYAIVGLLLALVGMSGWWLRSKLRLTPTVTALLVYAVTATLVFTVRARSLEVRYLAPLSVALAMITMYAVVDAMTRQPRGVSAWFMLGIGTIWWLGWTPWQDVTLWKNANQQDAERLEYDRQARALVEQIGPGQPVIVGYFPYYFTQATGSASLSIPASDDDYLQEYMRQYGARWVFLTEEELMFWRPQWQRPDGLPPWLHLAENLGKSYVFERRD